MILFKGISKEKVGIITFNVLFPSYSILYVPYIKPEGFDKGVPLEY